MMTLFSFCEFSMSSIFYFFCPLVMYFFFFIPKFCSSKFNLNKIFNLNSLMIFSEGFDMKKFNSFLFFFFFFFIFNLNFSSLLMFCNVLTTEFSWILGIGFSIWFSMFLFSMVKYFNYLISHLVPTGCPKSLVLVLFLIELISSLIRPLTLSIRLVANILAGHLILTLCSNLIFISKFSFLILFLLSLVEIFVSFIQAYIFACLCSIYHS